MTGLEGLATGLYFACVDFLIHSASLLGITYRDANALLFFVIWPAVTAALLAAALWQARTLRRLRADAGSTGRREALDNHVP